MTSWGNNGSWCSARRRSAAWLAAVTLTIGACGEAFQAADPTGGAGGTATGTGAAGATGSGSPGGAGGSGAGVGGVPDGGAATAGSTSVGGQGAQAAGPAGGANQGGSGGSGPAICDGPGTCLGSGLECCALPGASQLVCLTEASCWSQEGIVVTCGGDVVCAGSCCLTEPPNGSVACAEMCEAFVPSCDGLNDQSCAEGTACCPFLTYPIFHCNNTC